MYVETHSDLSLRALQEACETAYNNRARVPEHVEIIEQWAKDAASYRGTAKYEPDIVYVTDDRLKSDRTRLDIFHPEAPAPDPNMPVVIYIHGGYWQALSNKYQSHLAFGLNQKGLTVVMPNYDLCPSVSISTITEQMIEACAFIARRFKRKLIVTGHSAGGHLTAELMVKDFSDYGLPNDTIIGGMPISGLFDLRDMVHTSINKNCQLYLESARQASPLFKEPKSGQILTCWVGENESDAFKWQSGQLVEKWSSKLKNCSNHCAANCHHFDVIDQLTDLDSAMVQQVIKIASC